MSVCLSVCLVPPTVGAFLRPLCGVADFGACSFIWLAASRVSRSVISRQAPAGRGRCVRAETMQYLLNCRSPLIRQFVGIRKCLSVGKQGQCAIERPHNVEVSSKCHFNFRLDLSIGSKTIFEKNLMYVRRKIRSLAGNSTGVLECTFIRTQVQQRDFLVLLGSLYRY